MREETRSEAQKKMSEMAQKRSPDYGHLTPEQQWEEDKRLGILDWDGK